MEVKGEVLFGVGAIALIAAMAYGQQTRKTAGNRVEVTFTGGFTTDPRDGGRPVRLIAGALGVPPEVFREAFSHVTPARGGEPTPDQLHGNKDALLSRLAPYGITNDRLDEVSDYYRYRPEEGESWPTYPAQAYAVITNGKVTKFIITNPGSGYLIPPTITVPGHRVTTKVRLKFSTDLNRNGSIAEIRNISARGTGQSPV